MTSTPTNTYTLTFTIPAITSNLNIRSGPSTNHSIIGKLPPESIAYILGEENGWLKISTGSIKEGYISCDYVFTEEEVKELCDSEKLVSATITASILNVRSGPGTHYDIVEKLPKNKTCTVRLSESFDNWLAVELTNNKIGYISTEYAKLSYDLKQGQTLAEIKEKEQQDKMNAALAKANVTNVSNTNRTPMSMTDDQIYLFATVVYNEAGDQSYEGMLAVANVILNRIESKKWGSTLESVLYAKNQFVGAKQKYIERTQKRGIPDICYKAVKEALNGHNNIGDFLYFQMKNSANFSSFSKYYILEDHVFYKLK